MEKLLFIVPLLLLSSCIYVVNRERIEGAGEITTVTKQISKDADEISVAGGIELLLTNDMECGEIKIETNENIHQYISVVSSDDKVIICTKPSGVWLDADIKVYASAKQYNDIIVSGASNALIVDSIVNIEYSIKLSGASTFKGRLIISKDLDIILSGASSADISGKSKGLSMKLSGASDINAEGFTCEELGVNASGASDVDMINVTKSVSGKASGASKVKYSGNPTGTIQTSGASSVTAN